MTRKELKNLIGECLDELLSEEDKPEEKDSTDTSNKQTSPAKNIETDPKVQDIRARAIATTKIAAQKKMQIGSKELAAANKEKASATTPEEKKEIDIKVQKLKAQVDAAKGEMVKAGQDYRVAKNSARK